MIQAHAQQLAGIIRVGENYSGYPAPWEYQVTYGASMDGKCVLLYGLKSDGGFTSEHYDAVLREARRLGFTSASYERKAPDGKSRLVHISEARLARI